MSRKFQQQILISQILILIIEVGSTKRGGSEAYHKIILSEAENYSTLLDNTEEKECFYRECTVNTVHCTVCT